MFSTKAKKRLRVLFIIAVVLIIISMILLYVPSFYQ